MERVLGTVVFCPVPFGKTAQVLEKLSFQEARLLYFERSDEKYIPCDEAPSTPGGSKAAVAFPQDRPILHFDDLVMCQPIGCPFRLRFHLVPFGVSVTEIKQVLEK